MRRLLGLVILVAAAATLMAWPRPAWNPEMQRPETARLAWVATAHQYGPVGYRDPAGAISPDGKWIAYSEGRFLRVRPVDGGPVIEFPPGDAQIRHLVWHPDSRTILADSDPASGGLALYDRASVTRRAFSSTIRVPLRQAAWSPDGQSIAAVVTGREGTELWIVPAAGGAPRIQRMSQPISFPAWTPRGEVACVAAVDRRQRITAPCGGAPIDIEPVLDAYGPLAFSPDGGTVYFAMPNEQGTVDLWSVASKGGRARQLTSFARDSYAPSVASDGTVLFKVQSYHTVVAQAPADGGPTVPLAMFRSETPSFDWTGAWMGITYGTWRRVIDDAKYPDIAQEAGIIKVDPARPAMEPAKVVDASMSEDQSLCWSPNGTWIAYHSHKEQSDDIWLRAADGKTPERRVTFLGRGAETGWPRWSPDGHWLVFDGAVKRTGEGGLYVIGIDQENGRITREAQAVEITGLAAEPSHAEWLPDSATLVVVAKGAPGRHVIFTVARDGGDARVAHRYATEHDAPGLGVSPDGRHVAFVAPASDGYFQIFRMPLASGSPAQVTTDPSHKTQPAWSPDGRTIAFTVWNYETQFWTMAPGS